MWLAFGDDSVLPVKYVRRTSLGTLVSVGAVVFDESGLADYSSKIALLRTRLGIPLDCELKWSPEDGSWLKAPEGAKHRTLIRKAMLAAAVETGAKSVVVTIEQGLTQTEARVRGLALRYLYDKLSIYMKDGTGRGVLIADEPGGGPKDQKKWLASTVALTSEGSAYTRPEQIVLPIVTAQSHHIEHLQLADLVVSATTQAIAGNDYALEFPSSLSALAHRNAYGRIGGAGVTLWPPQLYDLYFWLFDATRCRVPRSRRRA